MGQILLECVRTAKAVALCHGGRRDTVETNVSGRLGPIHKMCKKVSFFLTLRELCVLMIKSKGVSGGFPLEVRVVASDQDDATRRI